MEKDNYQAVVALLVRLSIYQHCALLKKPDQTFAGSLLSAVTCSNCNEPSTTVDPILDIQLDFPTNPNPSSLTLAGMLRRFCAEERVGDMGKGYECSSCGGGPSVVRLFTRLRRSVLIGMPGGKAKALNKEACTCFVISIEGESHPHYTHTMHPSIKNFFSFYRSEHKRFRRPAFY